MATRAILEFDQALTFNNFLIEKHSAEASKAAKKNVNNTSHDESDGDEEDEEGKPYAAGDYSHLNVSPEIKEIFNLISVYKPHSIELEAKLRPFVPDYIPAIGEIDPFLKVPRPDKKPDYLGLSVLDEPCSSQSDPSVIDLKLRYRLKVETKAPVKVRGIENASKNVKEVQNWVNSINGLHQEKPPPTVTYTKPMPDIDNLMQVWPSEFEELLQTVRRQKKKKK